MFLAMGRNAGMGEFVANERGSTFELGLPEMAGYGRRL
jgi:hypothetical protein